MKACKCGQPRRADGQRYCQDCHNAYMRRWRASDPEHYRKDYAKRPEAAKAYVTVKRAKRAGRLVPEPCETCGAEKVEAHHEDYVRPLDVVWYCRQCHVDHHAA